MSKSVPTPTPVVTPALRKAMSSLPWSSTTRFTAARLASYDVTSHRTNVPPTSLATSSPLSASMSLTTTVAPLPANRRATPAPKPLAPPVIHATLPSYLCSLTHFLLPAHHPWAVPAAPAQPNTCLLIDRAHGRA